MEEEEASVHVLQAYFAQNPQALVIVQFHPPRHPAKHLMLFPRQIRMLRFRGGSNLSKIHI